MTDSQAPAKKNSLPSPEELQEVLRAWLQFFGNALAWAKAHPSAALSVAAFALAVQSALPPSWWPAISEKFSFIPAPAYRTYADDKFNGVPRRDGAEPDYVALLAETARLGVMQADLTTKIEFLSIASANLNGTIYPYELQLFPTHSNPNEIFMSDVGGGSTRAGRRLSYFSIVQLNAPIEAGPGGSTWEPAPFDKPLNLIVGDLITHEAQEQLWRILDDTEKAYTPYCTTRMAGGDDRHTVRLNLSPAIVRMELSAKQKVSDGSESPAARAARYEAWGKDGTNFCGAQ